MLKQLKTMLAFLLALTMLVSGLSFAELSEAASAIPAESQVSLSADVSVEKEADVPAEDENGEEPVAEEAETPAEEAAEGEGDTPTEAPAEGETSVEENTEDEDEAPAEVPTEGENAGAAAEEEMDATADEDESSPDDSGELSDAQKEALENLPEGFDSEVVALAMLRSSGCAHTFLYVLEDDCDDDSWQYTSINDKKHSCSYKIGGRSLTCGFCGKVFQTITANETVTKEERHEWNIESVGTKLTVTCIYCGNTKTVSKPCSHNSFGMSYQNVIECNVCDATVNLDAIACKHTNYTVYYQDSEYIEYTQWDGDVHLKVTYTNNYINNYGDETDVYDAYCHDCGGWYLYANGKLNGYDGLDFQAHQETKNYVMESHTFENGVCKYCGEKVPVSTCDHSAGNFRDELDTSVAPKYSNITETTHCVQYSYKRYCKDCGEYIKNVVDEGITPVVHDFSKGDTCPCGYTKRVYTISFSNISNGDTATAGKDLNVSWTQVEGIDHYEFAARYTDESEQCVARKSVGLNTTVAVSSVKYNKTLQLWVGAFANSGDKEPVCSATIQLKTTVCDHCADPDGWTFVRFEKRYVNVDGTGHVLQDVTLFDIDCSICGAKLRDYEGMVYSFDKEAHKADDTEYGKVKTSYAYTQDDDKYHTVHKEQTVTYTCACGYSWKETIKVNGDGAKEAHTIDSDGNCSVCGWRREVPLKDLLDKLEGKFEFSDVYKDSKWYKALLEVKITGDVRKDVIAIAESQIGYREGINNNTEYGKWINTNYEPWCASFSSWCIYLASYVNGIDPNEVVRKTTGAGFGYKYFDLAGENGAYDPPRAFTFKQATQGYIQNNESKTVMLQPGDLVFFGWDNYGKEARDNFDKNGILPYKNDSVSAGCSHVGILKSITANADGTYTITTIEGNHDDSVVEMTMTVTENGYIKSGGHSGSGSYILYFGTPAY